MFPSSLPHQKEESDGMGIQLALFGKAGNKCLLLYSSEGSPKSIKV